MTTKLFLSAALVVGFTSGCASITGTTNQSVSVQTREPGGKEVAGAACELTNNKGKWFVTTPGSVMVHRSNDDMQVLCNKANVEPGRAAVVSETKGSMFGNIIFGGGIGAVIDHSSGAAYEYPAFIQVLMGAFTKVETPRPQGADIQTESAAPKPQTVSTSGATDSAALMPTKETRLKELKSLYDQGLLTADTYSIQQKQILEN